MEFKEQKDSDLMQLFGNEDKNTLQYKSNISTGMAIQLGSTAASLLASVPFGFIPGVAALTKIGDKAVNIGISTLAKGIVGPIATKTFAAKSIRPEEIGENRKFLKGIDGKYLLSFALMDKTDAEIFDIAEKFMENYEYYSGEKAQKIKGVENRFKRLYRYSTKVGEDTTLLRETARKTLKRLKRMPITLYEAYSIAEYIELAKVLGNSTPEAQNMILIRMEEIKGDVMKSVNDNGDFSR